MPNFGDIRVTVVQRTGEVIEHETYNRVATRDIVRIECFYNQFIQTGSWETQYEGELSGGLDYLQRLREQVIEALDVLYRERV